MVYSALGYGFEFSGIILIPTQEQGGQFVLQYSGCRLFSRYSYIEDATLGGTGFIQEMVLEVVFL